MKKVLYSLLIFVSIFFVVDKVSAATNDNTLYFDLENSYFTDIYDDLKPKLEQIQEILNNNPQNHKYVVFMGKNSSGNFIDVNLMANTANYAYGTMYCYMYSESGTVSTLLNIGCQSNPSYSPYNFARYSYSSSNPSSFDTLIAQLSNDILLSWTSGGFLGYRASGSNLKQFKMNRNVFTNNINDVFADSSPFGVPYSSNVPIYNYVNRSGGFNKIQIGDTIVPFGSDSYFEPSDNYLGGEEPEPYIFDEYIEDHIYSKMIFNFDLSILESRDHVFDLMLNNLSVENEINDGILYETERFEISYPYLEYETSTGLKDILYLKDYDDNEIKDKRKVFVGFYQERLPEDITSLKLIIPLYDTVEYQLLVQLVSWFPFEVSYETEEEMHSYYEYIDVSNKYGAMFIPKLVANNSQITTYFLTRGIDTIYIYDTYDYKEAPKEIYEDVSDFTYSFSYDEQQYNLFFKTNTYSSSSTIYYDTRYFDYYIVDSKYSIGSIINPNTGENHYIDFSNTANVEVNFANIGDVFNFISDKIDSGGESYLLFKNSVSTFFNTMPTDIYILILTILAVILIGTALALGGWK